jgi:hypothetical protein
MSEMKFEIKVVATGEVRDADGNLLSSTPVEQTAIVTEDELRELGLPVPEKENPS